MLFEILTEDLSNDQITNDIINPLKTTSQIVQDTVGLVFEKKELVSPTIDTIRSKQGRCFHWTEAEGVAKPDEVKILIYAYTSTPLFWIICSLLLLVIIFPQ